LLSLFATFGKAVHPLETLCQTAMGVRALAGLRVEIEADREAFLEGFAGFLVKVWFGLVHPPFMPSAPPSRQPLHERYAMLIGLCVQRLMRQFANTSRRLKQMHSILYIC